MGTQLPLPQRGTAPNFRPISVVAKQLDGPGDFVLDGDPAPLLKKGTEPPSQLSAHLHCGQTGKWIKAALGTKVGLGPGHIAPDGNPAPRPKKGAEPPPQFSAHFYRGQTAEWIKMPLGTKVGLSLGDIVLDGDPAPLPQKSRQSA